MLVDIETQFYPYQRTLLDLTDDDIENFLLSFMTWESWIDNMLFKRDGSYVEARIFRDGNALVSTPIRLYSNGTVESSFTLMGAEKDQAAWKAFLIDHDILEQQENEHTIS